MSYVITPGPIPADGTLFDPRQMVPDLVNNTVVTGLTADVFELSEMMFVTSQTDPLPQDLQFRTSMWFKRGEGQLYIFESPQVTVSPGITGYTSIAIGVGPRVETLWLLGNRVPKDTVYYPSGIGYYEDEESIVQPYKITPTAFYIPQATGTSNSRSFHTMLIARDTGESRAVGTGGLIPMVIRGFTNCYVQSGSTCVPGYRAVIAHRNDAGVTEGWQWFKASPHHSADSLAKLLGYVVENIAQPEAALARIYKVGTPDTFRW